jgi:hypothetical protein
MTKKEHILNHLKRGMSITLLQSLTLYRCTSLAQRIKELRDEGYHIENRWDSPKKNYAKYVMYGEGIRRKF